MSEELLLANYRSLLLLDQTTDAIPARHELLLVPGPILDKCQPLDRRAVDKTPETAIVGTIAIVSHDEIVVWWHSNQWHVVTWAGSDVAILVDSFGRQVPLAIHVNAFVADLNSVSGQANNALNEITTLEIRLVFIFGKLEDDNVVALRIVDGDDGLFDEGRLDAINHNLYVARDNFLLPQP